MNKIRQLSVGRQVTLIFGLICAILVATGLFLFFSLRTIEHRNESFQSQILHEWKLNEDLSHNLSLEQIAVYQHVQTRDDEEMKQLDRTISILKEANAKRLSDYGKLADNDMEAQLYANASKEEKNYWKQTESLLVLSRANRVEEARNFALSIQAPAYEEYQKALDEIADWTSKEGGEMAMASSRVIIQTRTVGDILIGMAMVVAVGAGIALLGVTRRLKEDNFVLQSEMAERKRTTGQLDRIFALSPDIIFTAGFDGYFKQFNPALEQLLGYSKQELMAEPFMSIIHPSEHAAITENMNRLVEDGKIMGFESRCRCKDGSYKWLQINSVGVSSERLFYVFARNITDQKLGARQLEENRRLLDGVLRNSVDGIMAYEAIRDEQGELVDFRLLLINPAAERLLGQPAGEVVGRGLLDTFPDIVLDGLFEPFVRIVETGTTLDFEYSTVRSNAMRWYRVAGVKLGDGLVMSYSDITERKEAEESLRASEARFSSSFDHASIGMGLVSPEGRWLKVNEALCDLVGYSAEELCAKTFQDITHPDDLETDLAHVSQLLAGDIRSYDLEKRYLHKQGHAVWGFLSVSLVRSGQGQPLHLIEQVQDITERKKNEQKLNVQYAISDVLAQSSAVEQAQSQILETLCENLGWDVAGLWILDARAGVLRCAEIWGAPNFPIDEFKTISRKMTFTRGIGLPGRVWDSGEPAWIHDVVQDANFPRSSVANRAGLHGAFGFPLMIENEVDAVIELFSRAPQAPDAGLLHIVAALGNQIGQFLQRKRLEGHLFQSQKMETVGKLAGGIAHEFNSIMTAIIGQSEMILSDLPPDDPRGKSVREIRQAADRAATLTQQLLAYGRKQILQPKILDLNQVLTGMVGTLQHLMGREVDVRIVSALNLKAIKIDPGQMEQVVVNIAMNAADAMPNGGQFTLETANVTLDEEFVRPFPGLKPGGYVMLAMTDTGVGMSEEVKARVFEPFFSTKGVGQGTGLGLATCYGILKQSDGHINVYSEVSRGSTFKIYLPQVERQTRTSTLPRLKSPELPRGTETILLAEDDPSLLEMSASLLRRLGYTVLTAVNGVDALTLKNQRDIGHIDLLFTDVVMPHMSGKELSDRIRTIYPHTKILFTSAYTENAIVHQGMLNEGVMLLQKPFTPSALANKVREVLDQQSP